MNLKNIKFSYFGQIGKRLFVSRAHHLRVIKRNLLNQGYGDIWKLIAQSNASFIPSIGLLVFGESEVMSGRWGK